ncbi:zinc finger BED domain-containing protein 1-like [Notolabrus celidotus]|uniref:zinc finger BED domain-containing protein 1-like n=1 Tax=Notolabrus celidotus TaxID=1203425 RepID=UPI00148F4C44|nr:zinc finger BED domain-containing protein 1-like [Notolabrus celidotus]
MAPVLATLKCATTVMSAELEVSISNIYPISFGLIDMHLLRREEDCPRVMEFKEKVRSSLLERMMIQSERFTSSPPMVATMLDPRHKHLGFLTPAQRLDAKSKLIEMGEAVDMVLANPLAEGVAPDRDSAAHRVSAMALLLGGNYTTPTATNRTDTEVENFLREIIPSLDTQPTDWWKVNAGRFPRLAKLARQYLCIPATSVPSERVFSSAGLIVSRLRSRLTPEHVDKLIFLNKNK